MTNVKPIRRKSLWEQYDMLSMILDATEELLTSMSPEHHAGVAHDLAENRAAQRKLLTRAEAVEGVRHGL